MATASETAPMVTVERVAAHLGMSEDAVRKAARAGKIPARRVGEKGHLRFHLGEVEQALRPVSARVASAPTAAG